MWSKNSCRTKPFPISKQMKQTKLFLKRTTLNVKSNK